MHCTVLIACLLTASAADTGEQEQLLEDLRQAVLRQPAYLQEGPEARRLREEIVALGPNVLQELADAMELERDARVRAEFAGCFLIVCGLSPYRYSSDAEHATARYPLETEPAELPVLSHDVAKDRAGSAVADQLPVWWRNRGAYLNRPGTVARLREITGTRPAEHAQYDRDRARSLSREFGVYGIYNLPFYIGLIAEDNNPVLFMEFLAMCRKGQEYREKGFHRILGFDRVRAVQEAFPEREDKLRVIRRWWRERADTFRGLPELHSVIGQAIEVAPGLE